MPPLMQLPAYQTPNALMNFAPVSEGIDSYRKGQEDVRRFGVAQQAGNALMGGDYKGAMATALQGDRADLAGLAMQAKAHASQEESAALDREHKTALMYGGVAQQAIQSGDPNVMRQAWGRMVASHPEFAAKVQAQGVDPNDHASGLKFIMAQAAGYRNPLDDKLKQAQINAANYRQEEPVIRQLRAAGIDPRSEQGRQLIMNSIKGGSPMEQMIAEGMRNAMKQGQTAPQPAQQQGGIVPQSFDGGQPDGGIINVQTAPQPMQQQAPAEPMVNTPLGPLPKRQADIMGFGLAMQGKGDAGKMLMGTGDTLNKEALNDVEKQLVARMNDLSELEDIQAGFKPEFQSLGGKLKATASSWQSFVQGGLKDPAQKQALTDFVEHRVKTTERLNNRIKVMAGTAVSGKEEERMYKANPNAGTGIIDGDDPDTFKAKTDTQIRMQKAAMMRYNYLRSKGAPAAAIAEMAKSGRIEGFARLDDIPKIYQERGKELEGIIRQSNPNIRPDQIPGVVKQQLNREFGI